MFTVFIRRLVWVTIGLILVIFSVSNHQNIPVDLWPLAYVVEVPLYLILFAGILVGLVAAGFVTGWLRLQSFTARRKAERTSSIMAEKVNRMSEDLSDARAKEGLTAIRKLQDGNDDQS